MTRKCDPMENTREYLAETSNHVPKQPQFFKITFDFTIWNFEHLNKLHLQLSFFFFLNYRLSCSVACGIFLDQGSNPCLLHWQAVSFFTEPPGKPQTDNLNNLPFLPKTIMISFSTSNNIIIDFKQNWAR